MPLFGKASFKANRKIPRRRADAGSADPTQITTDKQALDPNLDFSTTPLKLNLGGQSMLFQNGNWVPQDDMSQGSVRGEATHETDELKERVNGLEEENNMLKYKIELLLDMLAVSNCDLDCMEKEIKLLKKTGGKDSGIALR